MLTFYLHIYFSFVHKTTTIIYFKKGNEQNITTSFIFIIIVNLSTKINTQLYNCYPEFR